MELTALLARFLIRANIPSAADFISSWLDCLRTFVGKVIESIYKKRYSFLDYLLKLKWFWFCSIVFIICNLVVERYNKKTLWRAKASLKQS